MKNETFKKYERKSIFSEKLKDYCIHADENSFIEVTEWYNGEGFDVSIITKNETKNFNLTHGEYRLFKKLVKQLNEE